MPLKTTKNNRNVLEVFQTLPKAPKHIVLCSIANGTLLLLLLQTQP